MNERFLRACRRKPVDATPIWFMRQAGRFLPEYRRLRAEHDLLTMCRNPELAAYLTLLPVKLLDVDAAILFADIMLPLEGLGVAFEIEEALGPVIRKPIRSLDDVNSLGKLDPESHTPFILDTIKLAKKDLDDTAPLIGFSGAPFTLACYLIEGHGTRDFHQSKAFMYSEPEAWQKLMENLTQMVMTHVRSQVRAGVDAVQIFDSWAGCLSPQDYSRYVLPYSSRVFDEIRDLGVPSIHFGRGTSNLLEEMRRSGGDVFGVDWSIPIDQAWTRLGYDVAIQGNLDPAVLLGGLDLVRMEAADILKRTSGRSGHIFNLGHGMIANAPVATVKELVRFVHSANQRSQQIQSGVEP